MAGKIIRSPFPPVLARRSRPRFGSASTSAILALASLVAFASPVAHAQTPTASPTAPACPSAPGVPCVSLPGQITPQSGTQSGTPAPIRNQEMNQPPVPATRSDDDPARRTADETDRRARDQAGRRDIPDRPTQFQRLVTESTGVDLPIFGASLFSGVPSTFAPVDNIPVSPEYVLGPGDELRVELYGQINQQGRYIVSRTGDIAYPGVGTLHVAGLRYDQLSAVLTRELGRVYRNFQLNVNLGQLRSIQVFVVGEARRPGAYTVSSLSTLLNALFASGGPLPQGSLRDIQLQRGGRTVVHFDLYDLLLRGDKSKDVPLAPGDVLFIPPAGPQAAITGSIANPAIYEIVPGATLTQLIALAGGRTSVAIGGQVRLERIFEQTMRSIIDVDTARGQNPVLAAGDIVTINAILNRYDDAVTLRGNVTLPGRYVWHAGMRITDLVPNRDRLITRDYYRRLNALGITAQDYTQAAPGTSGTPATPATPGGPGALQVRGNGSTQGTESAVASGAATATSRGGNSIGEALTGSNTPFGATTDIVLAAPDLDWSYAVIERLDPETLTTALIPFNPGALFLHGDQTQNLPLNSGDVVIFFSTADIRVPTSQQTRFVRLEGEFNSSGIYSVLPGETLRQLLRRVGGLTPSAYLYGSEFTRLSTQRVQQQRLNEYADNLEAQISAQSAIANGRSISSLDTAATAASETEARQTIGRLRQLVPIGRIVLDLMPDSRTIEDIPDLTLEDGDRFVVPKTPATVSVEGQVYSANAFVFLRGHKEHEYLRQAGGPDRESDTKRTFILRADGSVYSQQYGNVARATMFPGDTIVVPPRLTQHAFLRNLLDASSIIGQFGLGAAAISVFR